MGNCLTSNKILAENDHDEPQGSGQAEAMKETGKVITPAEVDDGIKIRKKEKKVVRFNLNEENNVDDGKQGESGNGVVRIRVMMTQKELKQILSSRKDLKHSSIEQLIRVVNLRGARVSEARSWSDDGGFHGAWRPALESIPEEH